MDKMKKENIQEAKKIISKELSYVTESCYYMEENYNNKRSNFYWTDDYYDKLNHLKSIRNILSRSIEIIYNVRVERLVSEEELGREIDERRTELYRKFFDVDRKIEEMTSQHI